MEGEGDEITVERGRGKGRERGDEITVQREGEGDEITVERGMRLLYRGRGG